MISVAAIPSAASPTISTTSDTTRFKPKRISSCLSQRTVRGLKTEGGRLGGCSPESNYFSASSFVPCSKLYTIGPILDDLAFLPIESAFILAIVDSTTKLQAHELHYARLIVSCSIVNWDVILRVKPGSLRSSPQADKT
jgi:hypothetical protein